MREKRFQRLEASTPHDGATEKASFLAQSRLFRHLAIEEISELERITTSMTCQSGRVLYRPGENGKALFLLQTGRVQLYHLSADGRKLITATIEAGDCFGETILLAQEYYDCFAEVVDASRLYVMNKQDVLQLFARRPAVALVFLEKMGQRLLQYETQLTAVSFKSTSARLAALLLRLGHTEGSTEQLVVTGLSQEELAEHLGVYRETVSTALRELKEAGAIEPGRKHITIINPTLLTTLVSPGSNIDQ